MPKKKKKSKGNSIVRGMRTPFIFAGGAMGASLLGGAFQSHIPAGMANPLTQTGATMIHFVAPVTAIGATGVVVKQLKKTQKKFKKKTKKKLKGGKFK